MLLSSVFKSFHAGHCAAFLPDWLFFFGAVRVSEFLSLKALGRTAGHRLVGALAELS